MGGKKRNKKVKGKDSVGQDESEAIPGKCPHIKECVKVTNLKNDIPHADLSKCLECEKLPQEGDKKLEGGKNNDKDIPNPSQSIEVPAVCVCLRCGNIGCSGQSNHQHAIQHYNTKNGHHLVVNLSSWVIWCYKCDNEVDVSTSPVLGECLGILKKVLHVKSGKTANHKEQKDHPQKKPVSNIYTLSTKSVVKGLANLGNTCFFNSVMQNLCQSQLLRVAMINLGEGDFKYSISPPQNNSDFKILSVTVTDKPGPLTSALAKFLEEMKSGGKKNVVNPGYLFSEICKKAPRFKGFRQQDSQELLRYLLDSVRTEEIKGVKRAVLLSFNVKSPDNKEGVSAGKIDENLHEKIRVYGRSINAPVIDTLFGGQLVSSLECRTCHKVSTIKESFFDLSLSLASNQNVATSKPGSTVSATKNKPPPAPVSEKTNTKSARIKSEEKAKPVAVPSKHQVKKKAKEAKKKKNKRKRQNSSSRTGRKQSEAEDDELDEDDHSDIPDDHSDIPDDDSEATAGNVTKTADNDVNKTADNDVNKTADNDVTKTADNDVSKTADNGVTKTADNGVTKTAHNDVTKTADNDVTDPAVLNSVNSDAMKEHDVIRNGNDQESRGCMADAETELPDSNNGVSAMAQDDVIETSGDHVTPCKDGKQFPPPGNNDEELSERLKRVHISEDGTIRETATSDNAGMNASDEGNTKQEYLVKGGGCMAEERNENTSDADKAHKDELDLHEKELNDCYTSLRSSNPCKNSNVDGLGENHISCPTVNGKTTHLKPSTESNCEHSLNGATEMSLNGTTEMSLNGTTEMSSNGTTEMSSNGTTEISSNGRTEMSSNGATEMSSNRTTEMPSNGTTEMTSHNEIEPNTAMNTELEHSISNKLSDFLQEESLNKKHGRSVLKTTIKGNNLGGGSHTLTPDSSSHYNGVVEDECGDIVENEPVTSLASENSKGREDILAFAKWIVDHAVEMCLRNIASILLSKEDTSNDERDASFERENMGNGDDSLKVSEVGGRISGGENGDSVKEISTSIPLEMDGLEDDLVKENTTTSTSSSKEMDCNGKVDEELNQLCGESNSSTSGKLKLNKSVSSEFEKIDGCGFGRNDGFLNGNEISDSCDKTERSPAVSQLEASNEDKVREFSDRFVENELNEFVNIRLTAKLKDLTGNISQEGSSEFANVENGENKCFVGSENLESNSRTSGEQDDTTTGRCGSEILCGNHSLGNMDAIKANTMSVQSCLKRFCSPEILEGDNMFICEKCNQPEGDSVNGNSDTKDDDNDDDEDESKKKKTKRKPVYTEAVKQLLIEKAPPILTLHLKRFHQVGYSLKKIAKHVDFPLVLDISPFCHKSGKFATDCNGKILYALFGVVEHSGSLHSGHYTAFCRVPAVPSSLFEKKFESLTRLLEVIEQMWTQGGNRETRVHEGLPSSRWYHISDSHVSEVGLERVLKAQAYLLFYQRMVLSHGGESKDFM